MRSYTLGYLSSLQVAIATSLAACWVVTSLGFLFTHHKSVEMWEHHMIASIPCTCFVYCLSIMLSKQLSVFARK